MATGTRPPGTAQLPAAPPASNGHGQRLGGLRTVGRSARRRWWLAALAAVAAAGSLVAVDVSSASATYPVQAVLARAPGLFPGAAVQVLGVRVGTVTSVRNVADEVRVGLAVDRGRPVPRRATASLVTPQLLGEPSIELSPGYTGGPAMRSGATIPESRTAVPVSTEQLLKALEHMLRRVNPHGIGSLVTSLAQDLKGQGKGLNTLIHGAAGTLRLLATKADDLGQLSGSLAQLTGTLDSRTSQISQLITDYDTVSGVIAQHRAELGGAITQLSQASAQVVKLLVPNLTALESDVGHITTVGRTLDGNLTSVDQTLAAATELFTGARRVYTRAHNWLTLDLQNPTGLTATLLAHQIADRLSGICRRVLAHHSSGLPATQVKTLETCSTPGFFSSVVSQDPTLLTAVSSGQMPAATASPSQMLQKGMAKIPGLSPSSSANSSQSTTIPSTTPTTQSGGSPGSTTPPGSTTCLGGLLGGLTRCTPASASSPGSGSSDRGGTTGAGGLLAYRQSLTAPAAHDLGPLPASAPGATRTATTSTRHRPQATATARHRHRHEATATARPRHHPPRKARSR